MNPNYQIKCLGDSLHIKETNCGICATVYPPFRLYDCGLDGDMNLVGKDTNFVFRIPSTVELNGTPITLSELFDKIAAGEVCPTSDSLTRDDVTFDLFQTDGTNELGGKTGRIYTVSDLANIAISNNARYKIDNSLFTIDDKILKIEVDVKARKSTGFAMGTETIIESTSEFAAYRNNGSWTAINALGGRYDSQLMPKNQIPETSVERIFTQNGTIATIHLIFSKP